MIQSMQTECNLLRFGSGYGGLFRSAKRVKFYFVCPHTPSPASVVFELSYQI